jgi:hypothetical protein
VFTYYLKDSLKSAAEARREEEKKLEKNGKPVLFPGWDRLRLEEAADKPEIVLTVKDEAGQVVRRLSAPGGQGLHRVAWDLRYPAVDPVELETAGNRSEWEGFPQGPLVVPGTYSVGMGKRVDGILKPLGEPRTFLVESLGLASLPEKDRAALLAFQKKAGELQRAMLGSAAAAGEAGKSLQAMKKALSDTPKADPKLGEAIAAAEKRLQDGLRELAGDRTIQSRSETAPPSLMDRLSAQLGSTSPITATAKRDYEIAAAGFEAWLVPMRVLIEQDIKKLGEALEAAGAPWTPGRGLPRWIKQ